MYYFEYLKNYTEDYHKALRRVYLFFQSNVAKDSLSNIGSVKIICKDNMS